MPNHSSTNPRIIDLTGRVFERLTVLTISDRRSNGSVCWECLCTCGNRTTVSGESLRDGHTRSCGCLCKATITTHGLSHLPEYHSWFTMLQRCNNPNDPDYKNYGGRGIIVCARWESLSDFISDMGSRPGPKYSIDRIDNNGNYCPENCRWATRKQQSNNRRSNVHLTFGGRTQTVTEWEHELNLPVKLRMGYGWTVERALTQEKRARTRRSK